MKIADTSGQDVVIQRPKNTTKRNVLVISGVAAALLLGAWALPGISSWQQAEMSVNMSRLRLSTVSQGDFTRDLSVQGQVVAAISPRMYSPAQGTITFEVDAGDSVSKGQVLAHIDSPELTNEHKQESSTAMQMALELDRRKIQAKKQALENQKSVDLAKVALVAAEREKRRADSAWESKAISQIDFEKAQDELENAKLVYHHAVEDAALNKESLAFEIQTQELMLTRQNLLVEELTRKVDELTLRSPVDGIVGNLAVEQKNQVAQNQPILSVVDLSVFELEVAIPESYADDLAIGMPAEITLNGETHQATLVTISPEIENNQVTGRVRFAAQSPSGLRQNQRLNTRILLEHKEDVLMVQRGQFLETGNGSIAYVVDGNLAQKRTIRTGARSLSSVEILDGLRLGEQIIISGTDQFQGADTIMLTQ